MLTGGRLTVEDAYAYSKFSRVVLQTNDIDFRARPHSSEEADFLAACVAGVTDITYTDVDQAPAVVLVGLEPEEECPILFLRLRKAWRKRRLAVHAVAPFLARGLSKIGATLMPTVARRRGLGLVRLGRHSEHAHCESVPWVRLGSPDLVRG